MPSAGQFMTPAIYFVFTTPEEATQAFPTVNEQLSKLPYKVKEKHPPKEHSHPVKIYEKGNAGVGVAVDFLTGGMIGSLNTHFYFVIEQFNERIVVAFHGNSSLQNSWLQEQFEPFTTTVQQLFPTVKSEWDTSLTLPSDSPSSPAGFRKYLGSGKWFFLT